MVGPQLRRRRRDDVVQVAPVALWGTAPASIRDRSSRSSTSFASRTPSPSITSSSSARSASVISRLRSAEPAVVIAVSGERRSCEIACRIAVRATSARCAASARRPVRRCARARPRRRSGGPAVRRDARSSSSDQPLSVETYSHARLTRAARPIASLPGGGRRDRLEREPRVTGPGRQRDLLADALKLGVDAVSGEDRRRGVGEQRRLALARRGRARAAFGLGARVLARPSPPGDRRRRRRSAARSAARRPASGRSRAGAAA